MNYLNKLLARERLDYHEAVDLIHMMANDLINPAQIAGILTGIQLRGIDINELKGFRAALKTYALPIELSGSGTIDLCGTGGDGKDTFNISTTTAFVLAAMGIKVVKHGNYGVSSSCGSSNVLEELGYQFTTESAILTQELAATNLCFIHAPLFHPVLKKVAPIRKSLGIRTFFNALGPLLNPVATEFQVTGTYNLELAKIYHYLLQHERTDFRLVYGMDGFDELALTAETRVFGKYSDQLIYPSAFDLSPIDLKLLKNGKSIPNAARLLCEIVAGEGTEAQTQVIAANVALALSCIYSNTTLKDYYQDAYAFIRSGKVLQHFSLLQTYYSSSLIIA